MVYFYCIESPDPERCSSLTETGVKLAKYYILTTNPFYFCLLYYDLHWSFICDKNPLRLFDRSRNKV